MPTVKICPGLLVFFFFSHQCFSYITELRSLTRVYFLAMPTVKICPGLLVFFFPFVYFIFPTIVKFDKSVFRSNAKCRSLSLPWLVSFYFFFPKRISLCHNGEVRLDCIVQSACSILGVVFLRILGSGFSTDRKQTTQQNMF